MKPLLEKGEDNNGKENKDDPFPRYDFISLICLSFFVCEYYGSLT